MTQSEAILEYIDGTLDHDAEQTLFEAMARQPELRATLRQFVSIGAAVHADREAYAPPPDVERALMANLGLAPNAAMPGASAGPGIGVGAASGGASAWFGTFGGWMVSFLLGLVLAGGSVYLAMRDAAGGATADRGPRPAAIGAGADTVALSAPSGVPLRSGDVATVAPSAVEAPAARQSAAPMDMASASQKTLRARAADHGAATMRGGSTSLGNSTETSRSADGASAAIQSPVVRDGGLGSGATASAIPTIDPVRLRALSPADVQSSAAAASAMPASHAPLQSMPVDLTTGNRMLFELRISAGSSFNPTQARNTSTEFPLGDNMSAGVYGNVSESVMFGVEGGVETYDQTLRFEGRLVGDTSTVEQRPRYGWAGIAGRAYFGTIPGLGIRTFGQMTLGGTAVGPLGRLRLGGSYDFGPLAVTLGMEGSAMSYMFNGRPQVSGRWGGTIGGEMRLW